MLSELSKKQCIRNFPLGTMSSFKSGGTCSFFYQPNSIQDLKEYVKFAQELKLPLFVFGEGTNILVSDEGFLACVVGLKNGFSSIQVEGERVIAGAGARFWNLLDVCGEHGLSGLEDCYGIPGTIGGALCGNAGVPNCCIGDVVESVVILDEDGKVKKLTNDQCGFEYRNSCLRNTIILSCVLNLVKADKDIILANANQALASRKNQPKGRTAGSVFKNPDSHSAGYLLDKAGLKGQRRNKAFYSDIHANFIVNEGSSSSDIFELIQLGRNEVQNKFGIDLECELKLWGYPTGCLNSNNRGTCDR